jgi:hypothetical protein
MKPTSAGAPASAELRGALRRTASAISAAPVIAPRIQRARLADLSVTILTSVSWCTGLLVVVQVCAKLAGRSSAARLPLAAAGEPFHEPSGDGRLPGKRGMKPVGARQGPHQQGCRTRRPGRPPCRRSWPWCGWRRPRRGDRRRPARSAGPGTAGRRRLSRCRRRSGHPDHPGAGGCGLAPYLCQVPGGLGAGHQWLAGTAAVARGVVGASEQRDSAGPVSLQRLDPDPLEHDGR